MDPVLQRPPAHRLTGSQLLLRVFLTGALLTVAPAAFADTPDLAALKQRLGTSRLSVQTLRIDATRPSISLDLDGRRITLELRPSTVLAPGFRLLVETAPGWLKEVPTPSTATYRGTVKEIPGSIVGATIRNGRLHAAVSLADGRLFFVQPVAELQPGSDSGQHAVYDAADVMGEQGTCAANEPPVAVPPMPNVAQGREEPRVAAPRPAEIAFDADFEFYTINNSSVELTFDDIQNITNLVNVVYERDCNITHYLTGIIVRTVEPDPYTTTDAGALLTEFRNHWNASQNAVPRDVAHLMTGKELDGGTIGIAQLGSVCNRSRAYGLSQSRFSNILSRRCALTAHELGHSWNANHCDGVLPCNIMCSSINGCNGIGLPNFEPMGIAAINAFASSRSCLGPPVAVDGPASVNTMRFSAPAPSPFTGETGLSFYLERSARAELDIYDVAGHRIVRLAEGTQSPGWHQVSWQGRDQAGRLVGAGVYYARLHGVDGTLVQKLVMLR